jgi:hypothetical protein
MFHKGYANIRSYTGLAKANIFRSCFYCNKTRKIIIPFNFHALLLGICWIDLLHATSMNCINNLILLFPCTGAIIIHIDQLMLTMYTKSHIVQDSVVYCYYTTMSCTRHIATRPRNLILLDRKFESRFFMHIATHKSHSDTSTNFIQQYVRTTISAASSIFTLISAFIYFSQYIGLEDQLNRSCEK